MDRNALEVAADWSWWEEAPPPSVPRDVSLPDQLRDSVCLVIQGVRRCGKSTLLRQLLDRYDLEREHCCFINFEDPRLTRFLDYELLDELVVRFRERYPGSVPLYFFFDEIQGVEGWQKWLRSQLDRPKGNHFVVTGSNATLLSGELSTALSGRHLTVELFPFDLEEARRVDASVTLDDYLRFGGFPEPLTMSDGDDLRRQYFHDIVERDVRERVGARSSLPIKQLAQMVFESAGSELSLRKIAGAVGVAVETAGGHVAACQAAYLLFECPFFAFSAKKRANMNSKFYPVDPGLRRVVVTRTGTDLGKSLECATYIELRKRFDEVYYWRGKGEVDFVVRDGERVVPIQVSWDEPKPRHLAALEGFYESFPFAEEARHVSAESFEEALDF